jgi:hypothetical protein
MKRTRRSEEQRIAELEAKILQIKALAEKRKVQRDPSLRHIKMALRSIDKAANASGDTTARKTLEDIRVTLAGLMALGGGGGGGDTTITPRGRSSAGFTGGGVAPSEHQLMDYIQRHPGQRGEEIARALNSETRLMRPVLHRLIEAKRIKTSGQARATAYHPI